MTCTEPRQGCVRAGRWLSAAAAMILLAVAGATAAPLPGDLPHGVTPEGFAYLGRPTAPVTLTEYSDYL